MKENIKQGGSIFFLALTAIPFIFSIFLVVKISIIKLQGSENLEHEQLKTITVAERDIIWVTAEKELLLNGDLFDIKYFKHKGNSLELTGFFDKEEDVFEKDLNSILHQKHPGNPATNNMLISLIFQPGFIEKRMLFKHDLQSVLLKKEHFSFTENITFVCSDIRIPPPKA